VTQAKRSVGGDAEEGAGAMAPDEWTTLATFANTAEAELARERLENEGVQAVVVEGITGGVLPFMGATMGGVRLQVQERDLNKAKEILAPPG
jgi:hypothetical protein